MATQAKNGKRTATRKTAATAAPAPKRTRKGATPKAATPAAPATGQSQPLTWLVATCPKRPGSQAHARASNYWGAATVADYHAAGGTKADLRWDTAHGFVQIGS